MSDPTIRGRVGVSSRIIRLRRLPFVQALMVIAGGNALAQVIPVLLTPVLTRLFTPSDMGALGLYTAFVSFVANALTLGYSQAIVSGRDDREGERLTWLSLLCIVPTSLIATGFLVILQSRSLVGYGEAPWWMAILMVPSLLFTGLYFSLRYYVLRIGAFGQISRATVTQSVGRMTVQIIGGLAGLGQLALYIGEVGGRGLGLSRMWNASRSSLLPHRREVTWQSLWETALEYRKFPLLTTPSSLLNSLALVLTVPLVTALYGLEAGGQFAVVSRIMMLPLSMIGASVGDVFHNRIARMSRDEPERAWRFFLITSASLFGGSMVMGAVLWLLVPWLFTPIFGVQWETAGRILMTVLPWMMLQFVTSPVSRVVQVYRGQEFKLVYDVLGVLSIAGVLTYGASHGWSLIRSCAVLGFSQALVMMVYWVLLTRVLRRNIMVNASISTMATH